MNKPLLGLTTLTAVLGAQLLRVMLPTLVWHWGANLGLSYGWVVTCAYAPTLLALAAPALARRMGPRGALWAAGVGLALSRLVVQFSTTTTIDVWAALAGVTAFYVLLILLVGRVGGETGRPALILGLLFGLGLDTALRGLTGTLDLSWIPGLWSNLAVIALVGAFGYSLWQATCGNGRLVDVAFYNSLPLVGLGLLLFVQWQLLQSQGWLATLTGWSPAATLAWLTLGNGGALVAAAITLATPRSRSTWWSPLPAGGALTVALALAVVPGWAAAVGFLAALVIAAYLLAVIFGEGPPVAAPAGITWAEFAVWIGLLLFIVFLTFYYFSLLVPLLPFSRAALVPLAGVGLTLCAIWAARRRSPAPSPGGLLRPAVGLGLLLLSAPAAVGLAEAVRTPVAPLVGGYPVRVMTYNVRSAFGRPGGLDVEAIAQAIEDAGTEVVALQELSRGGILFGSSDLLALLSRRLEMPYTVMGAASDPVFGNAILSRYPIVDGGQGGLPQLDSLIGRGYVWAELALGGGETLLVVATHLGTEGTRLRIAQVGALLQARPAQPRMALLGDMNARPGSREIEMILEAGFVDAWTESGQAEPGRIDWIFHTPDLVAGGVMMVESTASDHLPVVATLSVRP
jgi:endonuclease/exonuclease/phosphatase family metal-dependent hydrolase